MLEKAHHPGTLRFNLLANILGRFWSFVSVYLFVPIYIKYLGVESYGVVGFFAVLQGIVMVADAGLTATLNRELARLAPHEDQVGEMRDLVRTVEVCYWVITFVIGITLHFFSEPLLLRWVSTNTLSVDRLVPAVRLLGWAVVMQLPATLYQGGLLGLQRQVLSNAVQAAWSLVKNGGVILALMVTPTLTTFFLWSLVCNIIYSGVVGWLLHRSLPRAHSNSMGVFKPGIIIKIGPYAAGMLGMTIISTTVSQADKFIIGGMLPLNEFSYYTLASMIAQTPVIVVGPIATAVFPRLTALVSIGDQDGLRKSYHRYCQIVAWAAIPLGVILGFFPEAILLAWTRSPEVARQASTVTAWFSIGTTALAVLVIPHHLALANGYTRLNITLSIIGISFFIPVLIWLVRNFGTTGGGMAWTLLNLFVLSFYVFFLHRKFLPGATWRWYAVDIGLPLAIYLAAGMFLKVAIPAGASIWIVLCMTGLGMGVAAVITALVLPGFVPFLLQRTR